MIKEQKKGIFSDALREKSSVQSMKPNKMDPDKPEMRPAGVNFINVL